LGVILYTLVSGSLPFDGTTLRELRERVIRGKYRIPFYRKSTSPCSSAHFLIPSDFFVLVSTDCEALLKKFLALNPTKRYTLEQIMKDRWMNLNEDELKPYNEPSVELNDQKTIDLLLQNFKLADVEESLTNRKFNDIYATYLLMTQNGGGGRKLSRAKPDSTTSIASGATAAVVTSPSSAQKSETVTNGEGLKETSFMSSKLDDLKTAKHINDPPSPEIAPNNFKRQHTIGPESLKERNAIRMHTASGSSRPISATPKVNTERGLQKSPVKPLRAFKPENSLSTAAQTPRRPNINVYKKVEPTKDAPLSSRLNAATSNSSSSSSAFARNGPSRYTFHSGQSRSQPREHNTLESKVEAPAFGKGNFLQRLTTRFSKRFRLSQAKATTETSSTKN
jgi:MAP/microtubule affinity-regulating kinase